MKSINLWRSSFLFAVVLATMLIALWSCSKEDNTPIVLVPTITSVSPTSGEIGDEVTITGTNFNTAAIYNEVRIGGIPTIASSASGSTTITANVPQGAAAGLVDLTVKAYGVTTDALDFTVIWPPPEISSFQPYYGTVGEEITIHGINFSTDIDLVDVSISGIDASIISTTATSVTVEVPAGAATGNVIVTIAGQASSAAKLFIAVNPAVVEYLVGPSADDVEESVTRGDGHTESGSGSLNMGKYDDYQDPDIGKVLVGVRHPGVAVPQGATIIAAYLQCQAYSTGEAPTQMTIHADNTGDAGIFDEATIPFGVSSRAKTNASVVWDIPPWLVEDEIGVDQRTPDLRELIQEIVDRADWVSGNAMCFMMEPTGPSANPTLENMATEGRQAEGGTGDGPALVIIYEQ